MTSREMRERRLNEGLSIRAAAKKIGIAPRLLQQLETDSLIAKPHPHNAKALADFYGVKVTDLWPVDEDKAAA